MKKKLFLIIYIVIAFIVLCSNVYATVTTELVLTADKTTVKAGDDIIVSVTLKNISKAITHVNGYIDVDENVVGAVSENMIVKNSDGKIEVTSNGTVSDTLSYSYAPPELVNTDVVFNTSESATHGHDIFFTERFKNGISNDTVILKLKFTVKSGVNNGEIEKAVSISGLVAESIESGDDTSSVYKSAELSADLTIVVNSTESENQNINTNENTNTNTNVNANTNQNTNTNTNANANKNNTNTNTNKNTNTNSNTNNTNKNTNTSGNTNTDNTVSSTRIPAAGARTIIIPFIIVFILGFISYKKYMNYKDVK